MAGRILTIQASVDQVVKAGDVLFTTEAMKMETTVHAPFTGRLTHLYVEAGELVASQQLLAIFKPVAESEVN